MRATSTKTDPGSKGKILAHLNGYSCFLACTYKKKGEGEAGGGGRGGLEEGVGAGGRKDSAFICLKTTISYEISLALRVQWVSLPLLINIIFPAQMEKIGAALRLLILLQRFLSK